MSILCFEIEKKITIHFGFFSLLNIFLKQHAIVSAKEDKKIKYPKFLEHLEPPFKTTEQMQNFYAEKFNVEVDEVQLLKVSKKL